MQSKIFFCSQYGLWQDSFQRDLDLLASKLLAAALLLRCPKGYIINATSDSYGFHCEIDHDEVLDSSFFPHLEETMLHLIKDKKNFRLSEMVKDNAAQFLNFHQQRKRAKALEKLHVGLVSILQIGTSYVDFLEEDFIDFEKALDSLSDFKLLDIPISQSLPQKRVRLIIKGISGESRYDLKNHVKTIKDGRKEEYLQLGGELGLFCVHEGSLQCLLNSGVCLKKSLVHFLENSLSLQHSSLVERICDDQKDLKNLFFNKNLVNFRYFHSELFSDPAEEDLRPYCPRRAESLVSYQLQANAEDWGELTQALTRGLDALGFVFTVIDNRGVELDEASDLYAASKLAFCVKDFYGRRWEVASVEKEEIQKKSYTLKLAITCLERWIVLLLERWKTGIFKIDAIKKI